jgi:hypothetical protein
MLIGLGILLLVLWLLAKFVWGVASMGVHLLLAVAVIVMIVHYVRGRGAARAI